MTEYRNRANGEIITDLRSAFPHVSIPQTMSDQDCDAIGVDPIFEAPVPPLHQFQSLLRSGPEEQSGKWFWVYTAVDWTPQHIAEATAAQWDDVRSERDRRLQACDWTQLPDVPLTPEQKAQWVSYRQSVRDVTNQPDPFTIVWPVAPQA
jgi:hypothetical protein